MDFINRLFGFKHKETYKAYKKGISLYNQLKYSKAIEYFKQMLSEKSLSYSLEYKLAGFYCCRAYRNLGVLQFTQNNNKQALYNFKMALTFRPQDVDLKYFIGICLNNLGEFQGALEYFKKVKDAEPWNIPNKLKMAIIFYNLDMWDSAEEIYRKLLDKNPNFADVHFHLGLSLMSQLRIPEAVESFKNALNRNPNYIDAQLKLSIAQISMGEYDDAFANLSAVLKKHPEYADVYYLISIIKEECDETEEAVKYLQQTIHLSPKFKNAQVKLILSYSQLGKIDAAEKQIDEALKYYPDDKRLTSVKKILKIFNPSLNMRNNLLSEIKTLFEKEQSISELRNEFHKGLDIMPNFSEIIAMFSSSKYAQEDPGIADFLIPLVREQIRINPTYPDLYNSLGSQLQFSNKTHEAEKCFARAVELNPEYVTAHINLFKILQKNGKHEEAYEHGKVILLKKLSFPDVYYTMAEVLIDLKQYDNALINAEKVLKLNPSMKNAHLLIARIYEHQGKYDLAIKAVNKYLASGAEPRLAVNAKKMLERLKKTR